MSMIQCSPDCPNCKGVGYTHEEVEVNGRMALTGRAIICPRSTTVAEIQGLTGKRYDVTLDEFYSWWMDTYLNTDALQCFDEVKEVFDLVASGKDPNYTVATITSGLPGSLYETFKTILAFPEPQDAKQAILPINYNKTAQWAALAPKDRTPKDPCVFVISGNRQSGRSSLAGALLRTWCAANQRPDSLHQPGAFISTVDLRAALLAAKRGPYGSLNEQQIVGILAAIPCLVLDEWDSISDFEGNKVAPSLYQLFQARFNANRPTILVTDNSLNTLQQSPAPDWLKLAPQQLRALQGLKTSVIQEINTIPCLTVVAAKLAK